MRENPCLPAPLVGAVPIRQEMEGYLDWEKEKLQYRPEEIWELELPEKIRRILLLIKLNLGTNPHIFIKGQDLRSGELPLVINGLRKEGWDNIQASTSTILDGTIRRNPILKISSDVEREDYQGLLMNCGKEFTGTLKGQSKFIFKGEFGSDSKEVTEWFWDNSMFIFYPNRWDKKEKTIVGGGFSIETELTTPKRDRSESMKMEAASGCMGRDVGLFGPGIPGYRYKGVGEADYYLGFGLITTNALVKESQGIELSDLNLERLRDTAMYNLWRKLTRDPNFRSSLRTLQLVLETNEIIVDWYYHEDDSWPDSHKIVCIDFDWVDR